MKQMPAEVQMALGRIFAMMSRPERDGDIAEYYACRDLILNAADGESVAPDYTHDYARDRLKGAQGDAA